MTSFQSGGTGHDGTCRSTLPRRRLLQSLGSVPVLQALTPGHALAADTPRRGGTLRLAAPYNPQSLDPLTGALGHDHIFLYPMFDTLVEFEPRSLAPRAGLATAWEYPDPKTLVMTLREGIRFHDGTAFDASAVKANLDRALTDPRSSVKGDLQSLASIEVLAPNKVALHLNRPDTALPLILADRSGMMSSPKAAAEHGKLYDRNPVGTGPFRFQRWDEGDIIVVVRNDNYWKPGIPYLDGLSFQLMTDFNTALRSVMAGENHFAFRLNPQQQAVADRMKGKLVVSTVPTISDYHICFNYRRPLLKDIRVRQAINYAIDRDAFNKVALLGLGTPAETMLPPGYWAHDEKLNGFYNHDPDKARSLLAAAGYPNGTEIKFYGYTDQASEQRQEIIIEQLRRVGLRATMTVGTPPDMHQHFMIQGEGDIMLTLWSGRPDPSLPFLLIYGEQGFNNAGKVAPPPDMIAAQNDTQTEADQAARKAAFARLERCALEYALSCELAFVPLIDVTTPNVKNYTPNLLGKPKFNDVWLEG
jgi:ABC-type transport system substrate-binding protein